MLDIFPYYLENMALTMGYEHFFNNVVLAATNSLKASSLPGATLLSGCSNTANLLFIT
jgi:hypothetical protein